MVKCIEMFKNPLPKFPSRACWMAERFREAKPLPISSTLLSTPGILTAEGCPNDNLCFANRFQQLGHVWFFELTSAVFWLFHVMLFVILHMSVDLEASCELQVTKLNCWMSWWLLASCWHETLRALAKPMAELRFLKYDGLKPTQLINYTVNGTLRKLYYVVM